MEVRTFTPSPVIGFCGDPLFIRRKWFPVSKESSARYRWNIPVNINNIPGIPLLNSQKIYRLPIVSWNITRGWKAGFLECYFLKICFECLIDRSSFTFQTRWTRSIIGNKTPDLFSILHKIPNKVLAIETFGSWFFPLPSREPTNKRCQKNFFAYLIPSNPVE